MNKATFASRFFAWLIDGLAAALLIFIISIVFGLFIGAFAGSESSFVNFLVSAAVLVMIALLFLLQFLYFGYFWSKNGQSIGMKMMGIKVVRSNGELLTFLRAGLRGTIGYYISSLIFSLGYLWAAFDEQGQAWHDMIFDTLVVTKTDR